VRDALKKLHDKAYWKMERKDAMAIEHLLQEAHERIREGCPIFFKFAKGTDYSGV
jgi:hypothetical protein